MAAGLILGGLGLAFQVGSTIVGGIAAKEAADTEADILEQEGAFYKKQAIEEAGRFEEAGESFISGQKAGFAAGGVKLGTGSPLAVMQESEANLAQDVARIKEAGENAAALAKSRAEVTRKEGGFALAGSFLGAGSTFLTGLSNVNFGGGSKTKPYDFSKGYQY